MQNSLWKAVALVVVISVCGGVAYQARHGLMPQSLLNKENRNEDGDKNTAKNEDPDSLFEMQSEPGTDSSPLTKPSPKRNSASTASSRFSFDDNSEPTSESDRFGKRPTVKNGAKAQTATWEEVDAVPLTEKANPSRNSTA